MLFCHGELLVARGILPRWWGNESRAIYDGQELEELPSMRRRAEHYGLVVMCLLRI